MRLRRRGIGPGPDPITPMIDIAFFLLVFFLLIARLDATAPFRVAPPELAGAGDLPAGGTVLTIARDGAIALDGVAVESEAALAELSTRIAAEPATRIRLEADRNAELRHVLPLIQALEEAGLGELALVVRRDAP